MQPKQASLETVRFLQREGLDKLCKRFNVGFRRHQKYNNLVLLKYDQVRSNFSARIARECRGLILNESSNWSIVAWPFLKFFNYGEQTADSIDWESARVYEKLDGSLCTLYHYNKEWHVSSVGMPDAAGKLSGGISFAELFWDVWKKLGYQLPNRTDTCFMFELLTERNRIIVPQKQERIVLIGLRNIQTLEESIPDDAATAHGWQCVKTSPLHSLTELVEASRGLNPMENEGWVVCDKFFRRLKIKSPQYVALSYMSERNKNPRVNTRNILEIVRANEGSEFLTYYPNWKPIYDKTKTLFDKLVIALEGNSAPPSPLATACIESLKDGSASTVRNFLAQCPIELLQASFVVDSEEEKEPEQEEAAKTKSSTPPVPAAAAATVQVSNEPLQPRRKKKQGAPTNIFDILNNAGE